MRRSPGFGKYEDTPFFNAVRGAVVRCLVSMVMSAPGRCSATAATQVSFGGYVERGFSDIDWLPD